MGMTTKDTKPDKAEQAPENQVVDEEEKVVPSKGDDGFDTPSGYALAKAGDDPDKYQKLKAEKRWGTG